MTGLDETITANELAKILGKVKTSILRRAEKDLNFSIDSYFQKVQDGYKPWIM